MSMLPSNKLLKEEDDPFIKSTPDQKMYKQEGDFLYGHVSGTSLEEFVVIKYNKKNKP